jgi:hypothetical protein
MSLLTKGTLGALLGTGVLALSTATSLAAIACSGNVCWHTQERYEYPLKLALLFIQMIGAGGGTNATSGGNTRGVDTGAVGAGWNLGDRKRGCGRRSVVPLCGGPPDALADRIESFAQ